MAQKIPLLPPYRAMRCINGEGRAWGEWVVVQPKSFDRVVCVLRGDCAMETAHFIANCCSAHHDLVEACKMARLVLKADEHPAEYTALDVAIEAAEIG